MEREFWALLPEGVEPHEQVVSVLVQLENAGWRPRKFVNGRSIRFWRDNERSNQIAVDLFFPPNEHKITFYREHTGIDLQLHDWEAEVE